MDVFFSDLDNTLIYSHRRRISSPKIPVEYLNGQEQSFMTVSSFELLCENMWINMIPVTTRTEIQYKRLKAVMDRFGVRYALLCNGGQLIKDGVLDYSWEEETCQIAGKELAEVNNAGIELQRLSVTTQLHVPSRYMRYIKTGNAKDVSKRIADLVDKDLVEVFSDSQKVYIIAKSVSKGNAIKRLKRKLNIGKSVAAGDHVLDVSMLNIADVAICTHSINDDVKNIKKYDAGEGIISDYINAILCQLHDAGWFVKL